MLYDVSARVLCRLGRDDSFRFPLNSHMDGRLARAVYAAIRQARVVDKFRDPLYLFLELVRMGVMHDNLWSNSPSSGGLSFGTGKLFSSLVHF